MISNMVKGLSDSDGLIRSAITIMFSSAHWFINQLTSSFSNNRRVISISQTISRTYLSTQTATSVMMEAYSETTRTNLWNLQRASPSSQPLLMTNCTISGMPNSMMRKSAMAKFMMKRLVTERLIFLSERMMKMTRALPTSPKIPGCE